MKYKFFKDVKTVEELKRQYKVLAMKHHPDRGGDVEDMKRVNAEYDELLKIVGNIHETADGKTYTKEKKTDIPDRFKDIINAIIGFNCKIEICGAWITFHNKISVFHQKFPNFSLRYSNKKKRDLPALCQSFNFDCKNNNSFLCRICMYAGV